MKNLQKNGIVSTAFRGSLFSVICTLIGVLIFAGIISATALDVAVIKPVNQFIKTLSVFLGCFFTIKDRNGFVKGIVIGVLYGLVVNLLFSLVGAKLSFGLPFFIDLLFCLVIGLISGVISISVKKR